MPCRNHQPRKKPRRSDPNSSPPSLSDGDLSQKAFQSQSLNRAKTPYRGYITPIRGFSGCCFELIAGLQVELGLERVDLIGGDGRDDVNEGVDDGSMPGQIEGRELLDVADVGHVPMWPMSAMFRALSKALSCKDRGSAFMFLRTRVNSVSPRRNRSSASFWPIEPLSPNSLPIRSALGPAWCHGQGSASGRRSHGSC